MRLENNSTILIQWFEDNFIELNTGECHFMVIEKSAKQTIKISMGDSDMENTNEEKLLGVTIDHKLTFEPHLNKHCKNAGYKLFALSRLSSYIDSNKLKILMRAFVMSQFQYFPLAWTLHNKHLNTKINNIH